MGAEMGIVVFLLMFFGFLGWGIFLGIRGIFRILFPSGSSPTRICLTATGIGLWLGWITAAVIS